MKGPGPVGTLSKGVHLDKALLRAPPLSQARDAESLEAAELYQLHARTVWGWAARLGGPSVEPDDVVQEVFLTVHKCLGDFRGDSKITTWLFRITQNIIRHRRRKERLELWFRGTSEEVGAEVPAQDESPVLAIERRQSAERLYQILNGMKENYRTALILFEIEQLSGEEISELIGVRISTLWVWLHRARAQFLKRLQALEARGQG